MQEVRTFSVNNLVIFLRGYLNFRSLAIDIAICVNEIFFTTDPVIIARSEMQFMMAIRANSNKLVGVVPTRSEVCLVSVVRMVRNPFEIRLTFAYHACVPVAFEDFELGRIRNSALSVLRKVGLLDFPALLKFGLLALQYAQPGEMATGRTSLIQRPALVVFLSAVFALMQIAHVRLWIKCYRVSLNLKRSRRIRCIRFRPIWNRDPYCWIRCRPLPRRSIMRKVPWTKIHSRIGNICK